MHCRLSFPAAESTKYYGFKLIEQFFCNAKLAIDNFKWDVSIKGNLESYEGVEEEGIVIYSCGLIVPV